MIEKNDILADLHTHTIFSKHAYSTVEENINAARKIGLKYVAITDHYYNDGSVLERKNEVNRIKYLEDRVQKYTDDIRVIGSAEFNLGHSIFESKKLESLVWRPIGLHNWFVDVEHMNLKEVFNLFIKARDDCFTSFVHIERELHKICNGFQTYTVEEIKQFLKDLVLFASENDIWLEVNESSLLTNEGGGVDRLKFWLEYAKSLNCKIYMGTDAHFSGEVGHFENSIKVLNEINYPKELILNCNEDWLKKQFG